MKWFKHSVDSHEDPDISDAEDLFGDSGYTIFFKTLEVYGREYNRLNADGELDISKAKLCRNLRKKWKRIQLVLNFFSKKGRIVFKENGDRVIITIPKFIELASNWTKRTQPNLVENELKARTNSEPTQNQIKTTKNVSRNKLKPKLKSSKITDSYNNLPTEATTEVPTEVPTAIEEEVEEEVEEEKKESKERKETAHFSQTIHKDTLAKIEALCKSMAIPKFNPYQFVQRNKSKHPKAILLTLQRMKKEGLTIKSPWPYAEKILAIEHQNFNERGAIEKHEDLKRDMGILVKGFIKEVK